MKNHGSVKVSVIIPTYNRRDKLVRCLKSIIGNGFEDLEIIVVNDYPNEDLKDILRMSRRIRLIQNKIELLNAKSRMEGYNISGGKFLFFVDDDNILENGAIGTLVKHLENNYKIGLLSPLMFTIKGEIWYSGISVHKPFILKNTWFHGENIGTNTLIETDAVLNAYMIRRDVFLEVGGQDFMNFNMAHEDVDLSLKVKFHGYKNYVCTTARTTHDFDNIKSVTPVRLYYTVRNGTFLQYKYFPLIDFILYTLLYLPRKFVYNVLYFIPFKAAHNKIAMYKGYLKGVIDGFLAMGRIKRVKLV